MSKKGIDVSGWNVVADYNAAAADHVEFAIIKIIRKDLAPDKLFETHWAGFTDARVPIKGVYNYTYATAEGKFRSDAQRVVEVLAGRKTKVYLDVEDACLRGLGIGLVNGINAYAKVIQSAGLDFGIYTYESFYNSYLKPYADMLPYSVWIARYPSSQNMDNDVDPDIAKCPSIGREVEGWQYSSKGIVNGINGNVDLNIWYVEDEEREDYKMIKPVDYKQNDSKWGGMSYAVDGEKSTIKSAGCGPTAMADVLAAIVSPYIDPVTCAAWARYHNYKVKNSGTSYNYPVAQAKAYGVKVRRLNTSNVYGKTTNAVHAEALAELKKGNWLIACMGKGLWTSSGHFIVVYGYGAGMVSINDPASTLSSRAINSWDVFKSQVKYYWAVEVPEHIKQFGIVSDGEYRHEDFVREVQFCTGSTPDGKQGPLTLNKTITVSATKNRKHFVVMPLQKRFKKMGYYTGKQDKIAGKLFTAAVNEYQSKVLKYKKLDGEITAKGKMWKSLLGML